MSPKTRIQHPGRVLLSSPSAPRVWFSLLLLGAPLPSSCPLHHPGPSCSLCTPWAVLWESLLLHPALLPCSQSSWLLVWESNPSFLRQHCGTGLLSASLSLAASAQCSATLASVLPSTPTTPSHVHSSLSLECTLPGLCFCLPSSFKHLKCHLFRDTSLNILLWWNSPSCYPVTPIYLFFLFFYVRLPCTWHYSLCAQFSFFFCIRKYVTYFGFYRNHN